MIRGPCSERNLAAFTVLITSFSTGLFLHINSASFGSMSFIALLINSCNCSGVVTIILLLSIVVFGLVLLDPYPPLYRALDNTLSAGYIVPDALPVCFFRRQVEYLDLVTMCGPSVSHYHIIRIL